MEEHKKPQTEAEKRRVEKIYLMTAIFFALATLLIVKGIVLRWLS